MEFVARACVGWFSEDALAQQVVQLSAQLQRQQELLHKFARQAGRFRRGLFPFASVSWTISVWLEKLFKMEFFNLTMHGVFESARVPAACEINQLPTVEGRSFDLRLWMTSPLEWHCLSGWCFLFDVLLFEHLFRQLNTSMSISDCFFGPCLNFSIPNCPHSTPNAGYFTAMSPRFKLPCYYRASPTTSICSLLLLFSPHRAPYFRFVWPFTAEEFKKLRQRHFAALQLLVERDEELSQLRVRLGISSPLVSPQSQQPQADRQECSSALPVDKVDIAVAAAAAAGAGVEIKSAESVSAAAATLEDQSHP